MRKIIVRGREKDLKVVKEKLSKEVDFFDYKDRIEFYLDKKTDDIVKKIKDLIDIRKFN